MSGPAPGTGDGGGRRGAWVEAATAVLLSVAALAIAWSGSARSSSPPWRPGAATRPLPEPGRALTPFATPADRLPARAESDRLEAKAPAEAAVARRNIQRATNQVLGAVRFSSALFFGGISSRARSPRRGP